MFVVVVRRPVVREGLSLDPYAFAIRTKKAKPLREDSAGISIFAIVSCCRGGYEGNYDISCATTFVEES